MDHAGWSICFPDRFETERLLVRCPLPGDGSELFAALRESYDELRPWMSWVGLHKAVEDSEESARRGWVQFLERSDLRMRLFLKDTNPLVGSSGLHRIDWSVPKVEIGYWRRTSFAGHGYITEAVRGISAFAFEPLGARRLKIRCDSLIRRSIRVAERAGFRLEGGLRDAERATNGGLRNSLIFAVLPEEHQTPWPETG